MKMKRKSLATFIICLLCIALLAGCSGTSDAAIKDKLDKAEESAKVAEEKSKKKKEKEPDKEEAKKPAQDTYFGEAFEKKLVNNNGNYFVRIGDKTYFRNISPESMDEGAIFGEFLLTENKPVECSLISYDMNTCEWEEIGKITGVGKLYACPEGFYIGQKDPDNYENTSTELFDPETGKSETYCEGFPIGISESGRILAVEQYKGQCVHTVLIKDGKEIADLGGENLYYECVGFAGENLITMLHTANEEYLLYSVDGEGDVTGLGLIGDSENGFGEPKQLLYTGENIYICIGYYEGTGHFLSRWDVIKAKPGVKGSVEIALNGDAAADDYDGEGPDPDVPVIYIDETDTLCYSEHVPYVAYMGEGEGQNDLLYYDDVFDATLLAHDFIDRSDYENCSIIQDMESVTETAFVIYADAETAPEYDIGWRLGYRMTGWHICAVPFVSGKIIRFEDGGKESSVQTSEDPLKGLVSNDILEIYRESNPIKNPGSIEEEAKALGSWVQKNIKNIPKDIKAKGEKIGQRYEFWFGTDIGNNFDANFPRIYGAYYSLKDYYTSDGKRSSDYYDAVCEENEFLGNGNPENIEKMYSDMRDFITDCNNIIRKK